MLDVQSPTGSWWTKEAARGFWVLIALIVIAGCRPEPDWSDDDDQDDYISIYDLQRDHDDNSDPALGSQVAFRSVIVTVFDNYSEPTQSREQRGSEYYCVQDMGYTGGVVIQENEGGPYSGVSLFNPTLVPANQDIGPGDLVDVRGEYLEFCLAEPDYHADSYCDAPNTDRLTQLGGATVTKVGEATPPVPFPLLPEELTDASAMEQYEGVLVEIRNTLTISPCQPTDTQGRPNCCVGDYDRNGNLDTNLIPITNEFYSIPEGVTCISSIVGVVTWFFNYTISPRGPDDVVIPPECRGGI